MCDSKEIFLWRNSDSARKYSVNSMEIPWANHQNWLSTRIQRLEKEPFLVFSHELNLVGMARFDLVNELKNLFEISLIVNPNFQKQGMGKQILQISCDKILLKFPGFTIMARVHMANSISIKLFENFGFEQKKEIGSFVFLEKY